MMVNEVLLFLYAMVVGYSFLSVCGLGFIGMLPVRSHG
jgi:hypothetical protein